jgi:Tol biopolymer transport system component
MRCVSVGAWMLSVVVVALGCGRSGIELVESSGGGSAGVLGGLRADERPRGGDGGRGGGGGNVPTRGGGGGTVARGGDGSGGNARGGTGTGGNAGEPEPPLDPGGPIPDCGFDVPPSVTQKENRWLAFHADANGTSGYLVEFTPHGPQNLFRVTDGSGTSVGAWSYDGRYFAFPERENAVIVRRKMLDFGLGELPVEVEIPQRLSSMQWSPTAARYFTMVRSDDGEMRLLTLFDMTTLTERVLELPVGFNTPTWSPDGRHIVLTGVDVAIIDALAPDLRVLLITTEPASEPLWSPDGRFVVFDSREILYAFDTVNGLLFEVTDELNRDLDQTYGFVGDSWFAWRALDERAHFVDLRGIPLEPISFDGQEFPGLVSPSQKCLAYWGTCEAAAEEGLCVRTLPPDASRPSILIGREHTWHVAWAPSGEHVLVVPMHDPRVFHIELNGGPFERHTITDGIETAAVDDIAYFNPGGNGDFIAYFARSEPRASIGLTPRLWHRRSGQTFAVDIRDGAYEKTATWSPDGKYLVVEARDGELWPLYVQEVLADEPGGNWAIDELVSDLSARIRDDGWQP